MRAHGYYTTPTPRTPLRERPVLFALLFALIALAVIGVVLVIAWAAARPTTEEAAPAAVVGGPAYQEYRAGEYGAAPLAAPAVIDSPAYQEYRLSERSAAPVVPAVIVDPAYQQYRLGERGAAPVVAVVIVDPAYQQYRLGEQGR